MRPPLITYVTFNRMGAVVRGLQSILRVQEDFELYIIDNNSKDLTWDYLNTLTDSRIKCKKQMEKNYGIINAINWALTHRHIDQDFINIESDVYNCSDQFVAPFREVSMAFKAGMVHACISYYHEVQYEKMLEAQTQNQKLGLFPGHVLGAFFYIPASVMKQIGYYCEASYLADTDLNARIASLGFQRGYTPHVQCAIIHSPIRVGISGYNCKECHLYQDVCKGDKQTCNKYYPGALGLAKGDQGLHVQFSKFNTEKRKSIVSDRVEGRQPIWCGTYHSDTLELWEKNMRDQNVSFFANTYDKFIEGIKK